MGIKKKGRKERLSTKARQTKWAPVWAVLRKFGMGKRVHPSHLTMESAKFRYGNGRKNKTGYHTSRFFP